MTMVKKKNPVADIAETLSEFGTDTLKKAGTELLQTFNPLSGEQTVYAEKNDTTHPHSKLDLNKLQQAYKSQDQAKIEQLRSQLTGGQSEEINQSQERVRFFNKYKSEGSALIDEEKQQKVQTERMEAQYAAQLAAEHERVIAMQSASTPRGRIRKSILGGGHKKASTELPPEIRSERKPGSGKQ